MWNSAVTIFDGEDEGALLSRFVELSACHTKENPIEICRYIFKDLVDPELRAGQAAIIWSNDLEVKERIRLYKLNAGDRDKEIATKQQKLKVLESIFNDDSCAAKDRISAIQLHASIQGEIKKAIEQTNLESRRPRQVINTVGNFHA